MEDLKIEYIEIEKLNNYANNSKIHTKEQIEHIANSIQEFGFNDPLGIAGEDNIVLEGNGRVEAAKKLGLKTLPCVRLDHLSKEEQEAYVIAHNATNLETGFDFDVLNKELERLKTFKFQDFGLENQILKLQRIDDEFYKTFLTEETKKLVRNEFLTSGFYDLPIIKKQEIDLSKIKLMNYSNTKYNDNKNKIKTIHFFIHDYRFECVYSNPVLMVEKLKQYYCLLSPDFSLYTDMPLLLQMYNTFKNRWCGAYWQSLGLKVIPTISWSEERSFDFCFDGIENGSIVAISTHGNHKTKEKFLKGYYKMLNVIKPYAIICYGKPFPEMLDNNLIVFPYRHCEGKEVRL